MYTSYSVSQLDSFFSSPEVSLPLKGHRIYFIGIGGISMSSLAHIALALGGQVGGYDRTPSALTARLEADGVSIVYNLDPAHTDGYDTVVYTAAIAADNPELSRALEMDRAGRCRCVYRADFLGWLMSRYKARIGVAGMHGKSTVTSMISHVFLSAGKDPTVVSGAELPEIGGAYRIGSRDTFIMEACEYQDSFLSFTPSIAVILNIDMDHPDYFADLNQIIGSFRGYLARTDGGYAIVNADDANVRAACEGYTGTRITFGFSPDADFTAKNITYESGCAAFTVLKKGETFADIRLSVTGRHNILNALATAAAADLCGMDAADIASGLATFTGAKRRMEKRGLVKGPASGAKVPLYDDYGHHPTEIRATLSGAREMTEGKVWVVFQPHTYSRTAELFDEFAAAFASAAPDVKVIFADIYAAREENKWGVSSKQLADAAGGLWLPSFEAIAAHLKKELKAGDILIVMGAGDIIRLDEFLL